MSRWEMVKLGDVCNFTTGKLNSNAAEKNGNYPFFTCSPETLKISTYAFDCEAILLAGNNANGDFNVKLYNGKFNAYQRTYVITASKYIDIAYLFYSLKLSLNIFKHMSQGTATKFLTVKILNNFEIPLPPLEEQKRIAAILSSLDDKIEVNKSINNNFEKQMLFILIEEKTLSTWATGTFDDILDFYDNLRKPLSSKQREHMEKLFPYYGATTIVDYVDDYIFDGLYILISEDGANVVDKNGYPLTQYAYGKFWVNNHAHIVKGKNHCSEALIYAIVKTTNLQSIVTGAAQPKINQTNLKKYQINIPNKVAIEKLNTLLTPMLSKIISNDMQTQKLVHLRDTLLPRLMNGEI